MQTIRQGVGLLQTVSTPTEEIKFDQTESKASCLVGNCDKICRYCLAQGGPSDIYEEIDPETLQEQLNLFLEEDPRLPPLICPKCANFLKEVRIFRETVTASHVKLMQAIIDTCTDNGEDTQENCKTADEPNESLLCNVVVKKEAIDIELDPTSECMDPPNECMDPPSECMDPPSECMNPPSECMDPLANSETMEDNINEINVKIEMEAEDTDNMNILVTSPAMVDIHTLKDEHLSGVEYNMEEVAIETELDMPKSTHKRKKRRLTRKTLLKQEKIRKAKLRKMGKKIKAPNKETAGFKYLLTPTIKRHLTKDYRKSLEHSQCIDLCDEDNEQNPEKQADCDNKGLQKRNRMIWNLVRKFDNATDAENALKAENTWSLHYYHDTEFGKKCYYRCNKLKRRGPQCSAKLYLLHEKSSASVLMFKCKAVHDHQQKMEYVSVHNLSEVEKTKRLYDIKRKRALEKLAKMEKDGNVTKKKQSTAWYFDRRFDSADDAEVAVKAEGTWSFYYDHVLDGGRKCTYRCNKLKRRGPQCSAKLFLLFEKSSSSVLLYRSVSIHDHDQKLDCSSSYGLSDRVKAEINRMHEMQMKPKTIILSLMKMKDIEIPKMSQLRNYLNYHRRQSEPSTSIDLVRTKD